MGGPDTAVLFSVANTVANMSGVVIPMIANMFRRRTGSYASLFVLCAAMEAVGGLLFCKLASVTAARDNVRRRAPGRIMHNDNPSS